MLSQPELADLVIADLAGWKDWSAIARMVELFETATDKTRLLKPAAVLYLKACPEPAGKKALESRLPAVIAATTQENFDHLANFATFAKTSRRQLNVVQA